VGLIFYYTLIDQEIGITGCSVSSNIPTDPTIYLLFDDVDPMLQIVQDDLFLFIFSVSIFEDLKMMQTEGGEWRDFEKAYCL
jgi:hypothetical protein